MVFVYNLVMTNKIKDELEGYSNLEKKERFDIKQETCRGCGMCARNCPAEAIDGNPGDSYQIDQEKCIYCGSCKAVCPFGVVKRKKDEE
jgi:formate hydrogenlyase subunit 6/NADH:ubiquinone oxidoreductase subunit I